MATILAILFLATLAPILARPPWNPQKELAHGFMHLQTKFEHNPSSHLGSSWPPLKWQFWRHLATILARPHMKPPKGTRSYSHVPTYQMLNKIRPCILAPADRHSSVTDRQTDRRTDRSDRRDRQTDRRTDRRTSPDPIVPWLGTKYVLWAFA